jgi:hypothetical protein
MRDAGNTFLPDVPPRGPFASSYLAYRSWMIGQGPAR